MVKYLLTEKSFKGSFVRDPGRLLLVPLPCPEAAFVLGDPASLYPAQPLPCSASLPGLRGRHFGIRNWVTFHCRLFIQHSFVEHPSGPDVSLALGLSVTTAPLPPTDSHGGCKNHQGCGGGDFGALDLSWRGWS